MQFEKYHSIIKKGLYTCIIGLLFLPMWQQKTSFFELEALNGSFDLVEDPEFSNDAWLEGTYQEQKQAYINQQIGFRSLFVRIYNQWHFNFYNQAKANGVIVGKDDYLYEENYIKGYLGRDFIGEEAIVQKVEKLKRINNKLQEKGIKLIVLLAPGKGSFYPEYIPDSYDPKRKTTTNYEVYKREITKSGVKLLDFSAWFRSMKSSSHYPLFPKTGIHWSKYGEVLAADSILKYVASIQKDKTVPRLKIDGVKSSKVMVDSDDDIEKGMNLYFPIEDLEMGYADWSLEKTDSSQQVRMMTVADSYFWGMYNFGFSRDAFRNGQFWYYNEQIYPNTFVSPLNVSDIDIVKEVEKNNVVLLLATDANLYKFAFGFIDQLYDGYFKSGKGSEQKSIDKEQRIRAYIHSIKETPHWLNQIKAQAKKENISLDEALRKNAEYMLWQEDQQ